MIYTILVALDADPLLPLSSFTGLADLNFYQGAIDLLGVCLCMKDLFIYQ